MLEGSDDDETVNLQGVRSLLNELKQASGQMMDDVLKVVSTVKKDVGTAISGHSASANSLKASIEDTMARMPSAMNKLEELRKEDGCTTFKFMDNIRDDIRADFQKANEGEKEKQTLQHALLESWKSQSAADAATVTHSLKGQKDKLNALEGLVASLCAHNASKEKHAETKEQLAQMETSLQKNMQEQFKAYAVQKSTEQMLDELKKTMFRSVEDSKDALKELHQSLTQQAEESKLALLANKVSQLIEEASVRQVQANNTQQVNVHRAKERGRERERERVRERERFAMFSPASVSTTNLERGFDNHCMYHITQLTYQHLIARTQSHLNL